MLSVSLYHQRLPCLKCLHDCFTDFKRLHFCGISRVGSLNPRYGLFGDAVNTASRMESNSRPNKILCSEISAKLLEEQAPELIIKKRGNLEVKGKGQMMTYWVEKPIAKHPAPEPNQMEEPTETSVHVEFVDGV